MSLEQLLMVQLEVQPDMMAELEASLSQEPQAKVPATKVPRTAPEQQMAEEPLAQVQALKALQGPPDSFVQAPEPAQQTVQASKACPEEPVQMVLPMVLVPPVFHRVEESADP